MSPQVSMFICEVLLLVALCDVALGQSFSVSGSTFGSAASLSSSSASSYPEASFSISEGAPSYNSLYNQPQLLATEVFEIEISQSNTISIQITTNAYVGQLEYYYAPNYVSPPQGCSASHPTANCANTYTCDICAPGCDTLAIEPYINQPSGYNCSLLVRNYTFSQLSPGQNEVEVALRSFNGASSPTYLTTFLFRIIYTPQLSPSVAPPPPSSAFPSSASSSSSTPAPAPPSLPLPPPLVTLLPPPPAQFNTASTSLLSLSFNFSSCYLGRFTCTLLAKDGSTLLTVPFTEQCSTQRRQATAKLDLAALYYDVFIDGLSMSRASSISMSRGTSYNGSPMSLSWANTFFPSAGVISSLQAVCNFPLSNPTQQQSTLNIVYNPPVDVIGGQISMTVSVPTLPGTNWQSSPGSFSPSSTSSNVNSLIAELSPFVVVPHMNIVSAGVTVGPPPNNQQFIQLTFQGDYICVMQSFYAFEALLKNDIFADPSQFPFASQLSPVFNSSSLFSGLTPVYNGVCSSGAGQCGGAVLQPGTSSDISPSSSSSSSLSSSAIVAIVVCLVLLLVLILVVIVVCRRSRSARNNDGNRARPQRPIGVSSELSSFNDFNAPSAPVQQGTSHARFEDEPELSMGAMQVSIRDRGESTAVLHSTDGQVEPSVSRAEGQEGQALTKSQQEI